MKLLKIYVALLLFVFMTTEAFSQYRYGYVRVGISAGPTNYLGDLDDDFTVKFSKPGFGINATYRFHPHMSTRVMLFHGWAKASDKQNNRTSGRFDRNLQFRTAISEASFHIVYDFFPSLRNYRYRAKYVPYIFGGVGLFHFNPQGKLHGEWIDLQPLGTEGQYLPDPDDIYPEPYKLTQICVPLGAGVRVALNNKLDLEFEIGWRKIFTDYLDDVSSHYPDLELLKAQNPTAYLMSDRGDRGNFPDGISATPSGWIRGDKTQDDWYIFSAVTVSYILDWVRCPQ